jgi:hypothetical protein
MYDVNSFTLDMTVLVSLFSVAWLVIGILLGQRLKSSGGILGGGGGGGGVTELYVGNLSYDVKEKDLTREFGKFGGVKSARLITNKFNNKSKGFGFIEMADRRSSLEAIRALNGKEMRGRRIVVNEAKSEARS